MADRDALRVLIVAQPSEYGVAICVRQQAEAAVAAGHDVVVACPDETAGPLAGWIKESGAQHLPLAINRQPELRDIAIVRLLRGLFRDRDVVHLHSSKAGAVGRLAAASLPRSERPAVLFTTHYWSWQVDSRLAIVYKWVERALARRCDAIVAVSEQEAAEGRAHLGRAADRIVVIPNGVDRDRFSPAGDVAQRSTEPLLVCVGRLSKQKGQDLAITALARIEDQDAKLRLVGDEYPPGQQQSLERLAERLGVADRIEWTGKVEDTAPQFRAADVVIAPSRWEGMSLVFLEALACGAAVIVSDVAGSQAVGEAGIVIPIDDADSLVAAIDGLLSNPSQRQELGQAARQQSSEFDLRTTLQRNLDLWSELAKTRQLISSKASR